MVDDRTDISLKIAHRGGAYTIVSQRISEAIDSLPSGSFLLTDSNVAQALKLNLEASPTLVLEPGEGSKSLETFGAGLSWLAKHGARRDSTLVALGGGVIGDLGGFLASAYMRGIHFVQVPTTLLAMVDSSVGGKVGIDLPEGKNLAGAFYPPDAVRLCLDALGSLPLREFLCGLAEIIKYGLILDAELADLLEQPLTPNDSRLPSVVEQCIRLKAQVVEEDEFETTGRRAILNFGHTVAHAIEHVTGYGPVKHGEAVAIGMVVEAKIGESLDLTPVGTTDRVLQLIARHGLPVSHPVLAETALLVNAMRRDKKASAAGIGFSLLTEIGQCKLVAAVPQEAVVNALLQQ